MTLMELCRLMTDVQVRIVTGDSLEETVLYHGLAGHAPIYLADEPVRGISPARVKNTNIMVVRLSSGSIV